MKKWPKDNTSLVDAEDILSPVLKLYEQIKKSPAKDFIYKGYSVNSSSTNIDSIGNKKVRDYYIEDGDTLENMFFYLAFNLGIRQGLRMERSNVKSYMGGIERRVNDLIKLSKDKKKNQENIDFLSNMLKDECVALIEAFKIAK